jgi:hypothetical protein
MCDPSSAFSSSGQTQGTMIVLAPPAKKSYLALLSTGRKDNNAGPIFRGFEAVLQKPLIFAMNSNCVCRHQTLFTYLAKQARHPK